MIFSYVKLKQQEIRNVVWLAEMISRQIGKQEASWGKIIIPFGEDELVAN